MKPTRMRMTRGAAPAVALVVLMASGAFSHDH